MIATYAPATWRLLITPAADGATNMAIDEAILHAIADGKGRPTLRFYQWAPPCLSLGYNQPYAHVDEAACLRLGYTWVRRPTGGRAILHCDELTYSVIAAADEPRVAGGIVESYRRLSAGLLAGLRTLGAAAIQAQEEKIVNPQPGAACFDTPSNYEIVAGGKKLIGSAQMRRRGVILQHGALPLAGDLDRIFGCLQPSGCLRPPENGSAGVDGAYPPGSLREYAGTLEQALGHPVSFDEAAAALAQGFEQALNLRLEPGELTDDERKLVDRLCLTQYASPEWNRRI